LQEIIKIRKILTVTINQSKFI